MNALWGPQGLKEMINVHPLFVHFPIALLLTAIAFYFLGLVFRKEAFWLTGKWLFYAGTLSAAAAVWTGFQAAETASHGGEAHQILMAHQSTGVAVLIVSLLLSFWLAASRASVPKRGRPLFFIALLLLGALILQQADFGGRLVFSHGVGVGKKSMITEEHGNHEHGH